jgi:hypothetical protein
MINSKMYKVLAPIEGSDGKTTHWARLGSGFTNKDESINVYLDALPAAAFGGKQIKLQIRELSEEDLRRRDDFKRRGNGSDTGLGTTTFPGLDHQTSMDGAPF